MDLLSNIYEFHEDNDRILSEIKEIFYTNDIFNLNQYFDENVYNYLFDNDYEMVIKFHIIDKYVILNIKIGQYVNIEYNIYTPIHSQQFSSTNTTFLNLQKHNNVDLLMEIKNRPIFFSNDEIPPNLEKFIQYLYSINVNIDFNDLLSYLNDNLTYEIKNMINVDFKLIPCCNNF